LKRQAVVGRSEAECHLKRAGHYLAAFQMDMELVHADRLFAASEEVAASSSSGPHVLDTPIVEIGALGIDRRGQKDRRAAAAASSEEPAKSPAPAPAASASGEANEDSGSDMPLVAVAAGEVSESAPSNASAAGAPKLGEVDPIITPTYGQFVDLHVMPLYLADVPFIHLQILFRHYCGLFLDSDDEAMTWKRLRTPRPRAKPSRLPVRSRRGVKQPRASTELGGSQDTDVAVGGSPTTASQGSSQAQTVDTGSCEMPMPAPDAAAARTKLRAQMVSSVVEKRRLSMRAPCDMAAPAIPKSRLSSASASAGLFSGEGHKLHRKSTVASSFKGDFVPAPGTPEVSLALWAQPSTPIAREDAPTPVTLRRPTKPGDSHWLASPGPKQVDVDLDWGLLETPKGKRRLLS